VLDLGLGTGIDLFIAARKVGPVPEIREDIKRIAGEIDVKLGNIKISACKPAL